MITRSVQSLRGKRTAVLLFSYYANDPRPRRSAEALVQHGMTVDVICLRENAEEPTFETLNGVNIRRVPMRRKRGGKVAYFLQYFNFIAICFILLTGRSLIRRYHLVHVHNMPDVLVFSALIPKLLGAKIILDLHDPMPELMMTIFNLGEDSRAIAHLKRFERWSMAMADSIFTVNQACKRIFSSRSCREDKVRVVMNSPDESLFEMTTVDSTTAAARDPKKPFIVMYHGSLVERHGLDLAVQAMEQVLPRIPSAKLRVYGASTPFLEKVMESVVQRNLHQTVEYLGPKKIEEVAGAIRACDLGIIPNRRSIFTEINTPTRIFEYLTCGKPVIAPSVPGICDYFNKESLLFFELGEARDLARSIEHAYFHPQEVQEVVRRGQAVYAAHRWSEEQLPMIDHIIRMLGPRLVPELRQSAQPPQHA